MKKCWILILALLLLSGCGQKAPAEETTPESQQSQTAEALPEHTVPETIPVTVMADNTPVCAGVFRRGDRVAVQEWGADGFALVETPFGTGRIPRDCLRSDTEEAYAVWTGYSSWNAALFEDCHLLGAGFDLRGASVTVLDELENCYAVDWNGTVGYAAKAGISRWPASQGGGSGGSSGGSDGGDISLRGTIRLVTLSAAVPAGAAVKADGVEAVLCRVNAGDTVSVIAESSCPEIAGYAAIYLDGGCAYIRWDALLFPEQEDFVRWEGFSKANMTVYDNAYLEGLPIKRPAVNTQVTVLWELENSFFVETGSVRGFVCKDSVSTVKQSTGGSGGSGGGSGSDSAWSPPML